MHVDAPTSFFCILQYNCIRNYYATIVSNFQKTRNTNHIKEVLETLQYAAQGASKHTFSTHVEKESELHQTNSRMLYNYSTLET